MHNLERFLLKQEKDYQTALNEIKSGDKQNHWIWYIYPQLDGLVAKPSENTRKFSIKNAAEAIAYYKKELSKKLRKKQDMTVQNS